MSDGGAGSKRSLFDLLAGLPTLIKDLVRAEIDAIKADLKQKALRAGIGIGLLAAAAFILVLAIVVAVGAAIAGLSTVLPVWASALIVFGGLVVIAVIMLFAGLAALKSVKGSPGRIAQLGEDFDLLSRESRRAARAAKPGED